jgi:hypothetical protein
MQSFDRNLYFLLTAGVAVGSLSGLSIFLAAFGNCPLSGCVLLFAPLSALFILGAGTWAVPRNRAIFFQRLSGGVFSGIMGLLAYDWIRWLIQLSGLVPFNPFRSIEVFGLLLLGSPVDTWYTRAAGWSFHIWNGLAFASMYTLAVGRGHLPWAIVWAMVLELAMLSVYPSLFRITLDWPFVSVSLVGHLAYGTAVGLVARGAVVE